MTPSTPTRRTAAVPRHARPILPVRPLECLEPRTHLAAQLVADINPATAASQLAYVSPFGDGPALFFAAEPFSLRGADLYRTDGTAAGTILLKPDLDIDFRSPDDAPHTVSVGNTALFLARESPQSQEALWKTDGTPAGTVRVPLPDEAIFDFTLTACDGTMYFGAAGVGPGGDVTAALWAFEPSSSSLVPLADLPGVPGRMVDYAGACYFVTQSPGPSQLWRTDGTAAGTRQVDLDGANPAPIGIGEPHVANGLLYFAAIAATPTGSEPWRSDGTPAGTFPLGDLKPGTAGSFPTGFAALPSGGAVFTADGKLYRTNGTAAGTAQLVPPLPARLTYADTVVRAGNTVFFVGVATGGRQLWKTDGTPAGTVLVKDVSEPQRLTAVGNTLFFSAGDGQAGRELWKSDGTAAGTVRVKDIRPGFDSSFPGGAEFAGVLAASGPRLFFSADDGPHGFEMWVSDGTAAGTNLVKDVNVTPFSSEAAYGFNVHGDYLVGAAGFEKPREWWRADPDAPGGGAVSTGSPHPASTHPARIHGPTARIDGDLIYSVYEYDNIGIYRTDGTAAGTRRLAQALVGGDSFAEFGGKLHFVSTDQSYLWATDGTPGGTARVAPNALMEYSTGVVATDRYVYYGGRPWREDVTVLWRSDGTAAGTTRLITAPLSTNSVGNFARPFTLGGSLFYFGEAMVDGQPVVRLFRLEDDSNAPVMIAEFDRFHSNDLQPKVIGGRAYFAATTSQYGSELWVTDGTAAGTRLVKDLVTGPDAGTDSSLPRLIAELDGRILFAAYEQRPAPDTWPDRALWVSDGTEAGTVRLTPDGMAVDDVRLTEDESLGRYASVGAIFFNADDGVHGSEVWVTDGTPAGTRLAADVNPGAAGSDPAAMADVGGKLYFAAAHPAVGREVWKLDPAALPPVRAVVGRHVFYNNSAFDGGLTAIGAADDGAVAADKSALLPGQAPSYANYTNYSRGLNGIMIDVAGGLPLEDLVELTTNLGVQTSPGGPGSAWADAPARFVADVRRGAGVGGSDRITLAWPNNAIRNTWLRVTVPAMPEEGLSRDVFVFGNLVGETGDPSNPARVNANDVAAVKRALTTTAVPAGTPADINKDGRVNALDVAAVKSNLTRALQPLASVTAAAVIPPADAPTAQAVRRVWDEPEAPLF